MILNDQNHLLVVAGAGSGKTTTMSAKVKFLIDKRGIDPKKIMVISFTNKASEEIAHRIQKDFGYEDVSVCTFHKLGMKILKEDSQLFIITEEEKNNIFDLYMNNLFKNKSLLKKYISLFHELMFDHKCMKYKTIEEYHSIYCAQNNLDKTLILSNIYYKDFIHKTIMPFIQTFKGNGYTLHSFDSFEMNDLTKEKMTLFKDIYLFYQKYLQEHKLVDFEDMISLATSKLSKIHSDTFAYKYIIIDEYQDISMQRYWFIQEFVKQYGTKIMAVGDDFQSIFGFAGARIELFTDFKKKFKGAKMIPIINTYRNSQELIDVASFFVLKNHYQIKKDLHSIKKLDYPIEIYYYDDQKQGTLSKGLLVSNIVNKIYQENPKHSILLLGRYKDDIKNLIKSNFFESENGKIICLKCKDANITFLTVHSSKGLGFDDVILINASMGTFGFPSQIEDDEIFKILKNEKNEEISFPEERRLFYVALTRTKNKFYVICPKNNPSIFIDEIKNHSNVLVSKEVVVYKEIIQTNQLCPNCSNYLSIKTMEDIHFRYYECLKCHFKTTNVKKKTPIFICPKCNHFVVYQYTNANGFEIFLCLNKDCSYQKKIFNHKLLNILNKIRNYFN